MIYQLSVLAAKYKTTNNAYPVEAIVPKDQWDKMIKEYELLGIAPEVHESNGKKRAIGLKVEFGAELKVF